MTEPDPVARHYTHGQLIDAIRSGLEALGKSAADVTVDDLGPVDEFHIGGRAASERFLGQLGLGARDHVLDVGCGLGGASRFVAHRFASRVTGIDLTREYVHTGRVLCEWVGVSDRVTLDEGSAVAMPYPDATFDKAYMMHVGMNIEDKDALFAEVGRVLKPGGRFGIYDVMQIGDGALEFPVPWASTPATSAVATPERYRAALEAAGFRITAQENRREFALEFFARLQASAAGGPPPLGLHLLMGASAPVKVQNMIDNIAAGRIAPVEILAERPDSATCGRPHACAWHREWDGERRR